MARVLIVEDERSMRVSIGRVLSRAGHAVVEAESIAQANAALEAGEFDLILTDINLDDGDGTDLVGKVRADGFDGVVVVMTAFGTIESAVKAMKLGANDFLQKPVKMEELSLQADKWLELRRVARRLNLLERIEKTREEPRDALGTSEAWKKTLRLADRLASMPLPAAGSEDGGMMPAILLLGETGAGKGVLARYIHDRASQAAVAMGQAEQPYVHVNCSALPATLVESELFGHERGAFTDARQARPGLFEMADGGTIFLDEISEMPLELQAKLLIVVEQGRFRRIGGTKDRTVRARVIAASNQDLKARSDEGRFRRDLFYRLNAVTIAIPALREREDDVIVIAEAVLGSLARRYGRQSMTLSPAARAALRAHDWPGNVRELTNTMQRVAMLCDRDVIEPADLGLAGKSGAVTVGGAEGTGQAAAGQTVAGGVPTFDFRGGPINSDQVERSLIEQALKHTKGNVSQAARLIGLTRASMRYRMEAHGIHGSTAQDAHAEEAAAS